MRLAKQKNLLSLDVLFNEDWNELVILPDMITLALLFSAKWK
jgi:hypothetical protein